MKREMSKHDLQNERLDQIGRKLLKAVRASNEEIEKIVAAPHLFDSVKARIKSEKQSRRKPKRFFGDWASVFGWNRQSAAATFAILIVFVACTAVIIFKNQDSSQSVKQTIKPEIRPQITQAENRLSPFEIKERKIPMVTNHVNVERVAFKTKAAKLPTRVRKPNPVKPPQGSKKQVQEVFYSLAVAGNWEANGEDLQIVRTELSKSELFALGVNLPMENESAKVKTDLLVSADGVARAIRFVE